MDGRLALRRHLYEQLGARPGRRARRTLRRQLRVVADAPSAAGPGPDDGNAGVREPRRPHPSAGPAARER